MSTPNFSPWPSFTAEEADAVHEVLLSNKVSYWTGVEGRAFEREFAAFAGTEYAIALANGSVALDAVWQALNLQPGDEVVVTPRTFIASAASIALAGGTPVFADVDRHSQNITAATIEPVLTPRTKAIVCVHLAGWPSDMEPIMHLAHKHGLYVVEDCAQAHGATYKGRPVGSIGDVGCWSFCQDKIMTTGGEGGMVTTNNRQLWSKIWSYKDHGKSWQAVYERKHAPGFRWLHESFGTNYRMTEMQAAIGRIQLQRMPQWHAARKRNAEAILATARTLPGLRVPEIPADIEHAWYKCYLFVQPQQLKSGWDRDGIMNAIVAAGVPCFSGSCPEVYREKLFADKGLAPPERLPVARQLGETSLMFLVHPTLTEAEVQRTCEVLQQVMERAARPPVGARQ